MTDSNTDTDTDTATENPTSTSSSSSSSSDSSSNTTSSSSSSSSSSAAAASAGINLFNLAHTTINNLLTKFQHIIMTDTTDNTDVTVSVSEDIHRDVVLDLSPVDHILPTEILHIIHSYISVECTAVSAEDNVIHPPANNENRMILTAECPADVIRIKSIDTYVRSHDQGWADPRSASYSWCEVGVVDADNHEVNDSIEQHPIVHDATNSNAVNNNDTTAVREEIHNERYRCAENAVASNLYQHHNHTFPADHPLCVTLLKQANRKIALYKRSQYPGWTNTTASTAIRIVYVRSYIRPTAEQIEAIQRKRNEQQEQQQQGNQLPMLNH
jgi:hypothetical protein